ncbi:MAG: hypothetical protein ACTSRA_03235 [Promethearchaeota archaeon]
MVQIIDYIVWSGCIERDAGRRHALKWWQWVLVYNWRAFEFKCYSSSFLKSG